MVTRRYVHTRRFHVSSIVEYLRRRGSIGQRRSSRVVWRWSITRREAKSNIYSQVAAWQFNGLGERLHVARAAIEVANGWGRLRCAVLTAAKDSGAVSAGCVVVGWSWRYEGVKGAGVPVKSCMQRIRGAEQPPSASPTSRASQSEGRAPCMRWHQPGIPCNHGTRHSCSTVLVQIDPLCGGELMLRTLRRALLQCFSIESCAGASSSFRLRLCYGG